MSKSSFVPPLPHIDPPDDETLEKMQNTDYSKNLKVQNAIRQSKSDDKKRKRRSKIQWWKDNWIQILAMLFAFIAALPVICKGIASILRYIM